MTPSVLPYEPALSSNDAFDALLGSLKPITSASKPQPTSEEPVTHNPFFDSQRTPELQVHESTENPTAETANLTLTDNLGVTNASTLSPTLGLFNELGSVEKDEMRELLEAAWKEDPLATLKIIWSARSIPRGKGEKEAWTRGVAWLAEEHPQTLLRNLENVVLPLDIIPKKRKADDQEQESDADLCEVEEEAAELTPASARSHGYFKDLLNLLYLSSLPSTATPTKSELALTGDYSRLAGYAVKDDSTYAGARKKGKGRAVTETKEDKLGQLEAKLGEQSQHSFHRALNSTVARIFGRQLKEDLESLEQAKALRNDGKQDEAVQIERRISLAAKWAPTEGNSDDKQTRIASSIAEYLTPLSVDRSSSSLVRSLSIYRTKYLAPLRNHLDIVERHMSGGNWSSINYSRVPSLAMNRNKKHFSKHDKEGFTKYLLRVAEGKASISGAALTPSSLAQQAGRGSAESIDGQVVEAQWRTLVQSIKDAGTLSNCVGVADVSGSMYGPQLSDGTTPLDSSLGLSILLAQVAEPPFNNAVISFSYEPRFIDLKGNSLREHLDRIKSTGVGYNTDFAKLMRTVLARAVGVKLKPEQMVKRIFIFSDMEFDEAQSGSQNPYQTHHEIIKSEYEAAGYPLPEMIYWNLAARFGQRNSKPVTAHTEGAALVSGYSAAILKVFLDGADFEGAAEEEEEGWEEVVGEDGETVKVKAEGGEKRIDPTAVMRKAIGHASFDGLKVYD
ncbi:hypothetical protein BCR35DRAFT_281512 [Leucosporidium creatinivorum]|uniref:Uncharacterized protein n=1 Tax=Leucosporidium creatinivorum TaxID=106004 RepID=A0A1Y2ERY6_9BASI|nr:hypothetical protein BCR35DRAFT_281512 [Leucosporidium creatinivorum]